MSDFQISPFDPEAHGAFVYDGWLDGFRGAHAAGPIPRPLYRTVYRAVIDHLLERGMTVLVAHSASGPEPLFGFVAFEPPAALHFLYVKQPYRRRGIARALMDAAGLGRHARFVYSHKTERARDLEPHWPDARFNPDAARRAPRGEKR